MIGPGTVCALLKDSLGNTWTGNPSGLFKYQKKTDSFTRFSKADGLIDNFVSGIVEEKPGLLWISTAKGLSKFNYEKNTFDNYKVGVFNRGVASIKTSSNKLLFGTPNGIFHLYPDKIKTNTFKPKVVLTSFKVLNKEINTKTPLSKLKKFNLTHKDKFFSFEFSALDYSDTGSNRYKYKLEGFDKDWITLGPQRHFAGYTNIAGGNYTLRVKGTNNDGLWNEDKDGVILKIHISSPFWQTTWFSFFAWIAVFSTICIVAYYVVKLLKEITERKHAEDTLSLRSQELDHANQELSKNIQLLNQAQEIVHIGHFNYDITNNHLVWADEVYRIFKKDPEVFSPAYENYFGYLHPDDQDRARKEYARSLENKTGFDFQARILFDDGEIKYIQNTGKNEYNQDGEPVRSVGMILDITSRKVADKNLLLSEQKLAMHFMQTPLAVIEWNIDCKIRAWNPAAEAIFGYTQMEILGKHASVIIPEKHRKYIDAAWAELLEQKGGSRSTNKNLNKNGDELFCEWFNTSIVNETGDTIAVFSLVQNITSRRQAEIEKKKLTSRLQQAQKMESIGTLAGGIAHDFNNILVPIFGYLEMVIEEVPSSARDLLGEVYNGAQRARELVKQILTFSRQSDHELKPLNPHIVIREALRLLRSSIPSSIQINQNINKNCGMVMADPTHIHQIVMNLCTNAFHAMEETGGELNVFLSKIDFSEIDLKDPGMSPGPHICLAVSDTGQGIERQILNQIFDPYFTTKKEGKGTGLGLSVIHGIVKDYKGHISVYSEPGKGTEFKIFLPTIQASNEAQKTKPDIPLQGGSESILMVDDEPVIVDLGKKILERLGYQVTVQSSSLDALELFRSKPDNFDLVITDMAMPNMTGDKLAGLMIQIRSNIPVIMCTGFSETMTEQKAKDLGIKGFLMKPIVMQELSVKIREVLDESKGE